MKQTAINWLIDISKQRELDKFDFEKALEMERKQIEDAVNNSGGLVNIILWDENITISKGEQYFNKTYNSRD